jgi:stage III sporulation protein SpoIIIAA
MDKTKLIKDLQRCIYKRDGQDRVSVAKLKLVINRLSGQSIYSENETKLKKSRTYKLKWW